MSDEIIPNPQTPKTEPQIELVSEPVEATIPSEPEPTAQIPVNEPLDIPVETEVKPVETPPEELPPSASLPEEKPLASPEPVEEAKSEVTETIPDQIQPETEKATEPVIENKPVEQIQETKPEPESKPEPEQPKIIPIIISKKNLARELLVKARNAIQSRKEKN